MIANRAIGSVLGAHQSLRWRLAGDPEPLNFLSAFLGTSDKHFTYGDFGVPESDWAYKALRENTQQQ